MGYFLIWWLIVQVLGLLALPVVLRICRNLPDRGYPLAKSVGIVVFAFVVWLFGTGVRFVTMSAGVTWALLIVLLAGSGYLAYRGRERYLRFFRENAIYVVIVEAVFLLAMAYLARMRSFHPDIIDQEKFMDMAFVNAIIRSPHYPPNDPWLAGLSINYYYFGHFMDATLTKLSGISSAITFNLAIALLFALTITNAFSVTYNLLALRWWRTSRAHGRSLGAARRRTPDIGDDDDDDGMERGRGEKPMARRQAPRPRPDDDDEYDDEGMERGRGEKSTARWPSAKRAPEPKIREPEPVAAMADLDVDDEPPAPPVRPSVPKARPARSYDEEDDDDLERGRGEKPVVRRPAARPAPAPAAAQAARPAVPYAKPAAPARSAQPESSAARSRRRRTTRPSQQSARPAARGNGLRLASGLPLRYVPWALLTAIALADFGNLASAFQVLGISVSHDLGNGGHSPAPWGLGGAVHAFFAVVGGFPKFLGAIFNPASISSFNWWDPSRVVYGPNNGMTINEFPAFSWLLADLHAHVLALPFTVLAAGLALNLLAARGRGLDALGRGAWQIATMLVYGITLGALYFTNGWDMPTYLVLALGCLAVQQFLAHGVRDIGGTVIGLVKTGLPIFVLAFVLYLPLWLTFKSPAQGIQVSLTHTELNQFVAMFGIILFPVCSWLLSRVAERYGFGRLGKIALVAAFIAFVGLLFVVNKGTTPLLLVMLGMVVLLVPRDGDRVPDMFVLLIIGGCCLLTAATDAIYIKDTFGNRMNTVFKFYYQTWTLWTIAGGYATYYFAHRLARAARALGDKTSAMLKSPLQLAGAGGLCVWVVVMLCLGVAGLSYPFLGEYAFTGAYAHQPGLDGMSFLDQAATWDGASTGWLEKTNSQPDANVAAAQTDGDAITWLNKNVPGDPVIVEGKWYDGAPSDVGVGMQDEYSHFARISTFTGLPTILGWAGHEQQWGRDYGTYMTPRIADIKTIYTSPNKQTVLDTMKQYNATLLYVGPLEEELYPAPADLTRFSQFMTPIGCGKDWTVYSTQPIGNLTCSTQQQQQQSTGPTPTTAPVVPGWSTTPVAASASFGTGGSGQGQLTAPNTVALDKQGNVYVLDTGNERVEVFDSTGKFVRAFGSKGDGNGQFNGDYGGPRGIAIGPDGTIYVTDTWYKDSGRIEVFGADGTYKSSWITYGQGQSFHGPRGVAVGADGTVYVTDTGNRSVVVFKSDGTYVTSFGKQGSGPGEFTENSGIAVGPNGHLYITDMWNQRIVEMTASGTFVAAYPVHAWSTTGYDEPYIATDAHGNVYATDPENNGVFKLNPQGKLLGDYTVSGQALNKPLGIAVAPDGRVYVVDSMNNRVVVLDKM